MSREDGEDERRPGGAEWAPSEFTAILPRWTPEEYRQRPREFDPGRAEAIISRVANGESLSNICCDRDMPLPATFLRWMRSEPEYGRMFADAQNDRADVLAEEMLVFSGHPDPRVGKLEFEVRRFHAVSQNPGKYSERQRGERKNDDAGGSPDYSGELRRKIEGMAERYAEQRRPAEGTP